MTREAPAAATTQPTALALSGGAPEQHAHPPGASVHALSAMFHAVVTLGGIQVAAMACNLLRSKIVALTLGPTGVGAISLIDQLSSLVMQVSAFSLPLAAVKFLSASHSESREAFARLYSGFLSALLFVSLLGTGIAAALLLSHPEVLGSKLRDYRHLALLALLAVPGTNVVLLLTNVLAAARRARASALFSLLMAALLAATSWPAVVTAGLTGYYAANMTAMLLLAVGGLVYLKKRHGLTIWTKAAGALAEIRRYPAVLSFSAAMYLTSFTSPLSDLLVRYAVLDSAGLRMTGLFQAAFGLAMTLRNLLRSSFALLLTPSLNRKIDNRAKLADAGAFLRVVATLVLALSLPLVLLPEAWMTVLYSRRFVEAAPAVYLFVLGISLQMFAAVNVALLVGVDDVSAYVRASVVGDFATAAFAWWLAPRFGVPGAALAFIADGILLLALSTWWLWSRHRLAVWRAVGWSPLRAVLLLAAAGLLGNRLQPNTGIVLAVKLAICPAGACLLLKSFGMRGLIERGKTLGRPTA